MGDPLAGAISYHRAVTAFRLHALDGEALLFDRRDGTSIHVRAPFTRHLRRRAPRVVQFAITNRCNLSCDFCYRALEAESAWTVDDAVTILSDLDRAGVLEVAFGGGEPFAFRGFPRLLSRLAAETRLAVSITTNGLLLDRALLDEIEGTYAELRVSLYDEASLAAIDRLGGRRFGVNVLVTPQRLPELERIVFDLAARGAKSVLLLSYNGDDALHLDAAETRVLGLRLERLAHALRGRTAIATSICFGDRLGPLPRALPSPQCDAGRDFISITSDRCVQACSFQRDKVKIESAEDVLAAFADRTSMGAPAPVRGCARLTMLPTKPSAIADDTEIRVYSTFASNNSGSYTLVGTLPDLEAAKAFGVELTTLFSEHSAWREDEARVMPSPLHRFAEKLGLVVEGGGTPDDEDWPNHGPPPQALVLGHQVIVHVDYTVTMPRIFGHAIFQLGGRVAVEHVHAHHALVAELRVFVERGWERDRREMAAATLAAVTKELDEVVLPSLLGTRAPHERILEPAWSTDVHLVRVAVVFADIVAGIAAVDACVRRHGAILYVDVCEAPIGAGDPLLGWRGTAPGTGAWQVVLWRPGDDRVAAMKALRDVAGFGLDEVKSKLDQLPAVVLDNVSEDVAKEGARILVEAGCRADAFIPR